MAKKFLALLMLSICILFCLTGCTNKAEPIALPEIEEISSISIDQINGTQVSFEDSDNIQKILSTISNGKATRKPSIQDVPVAEKQGTINIKNSDRITTIFYYEEDGKYYIEQPYQGIYEIEDDFENLLSETLKQ